MRILPGIGAAGEWNGSVHNSQALAGQGRGDRWERIRDCRFGIKVPDLAPLRTPPANCANATPRPSRCQEAVFALQQQNPCGTRVFGPSASGPRSSSGLPHGALARAADRVRLLGLFIAVVVIP